MELIGLIWEHFEANAPESPSPILNPKNTVLIERLAKRFGVPNKPENVPKTKSRFRRLPEWGDY